MTSVKKEMMNSIVDNGLIASALSVVSGLAVTQTPITAFFGLVTVGTAAAVSAPVMAGYGLIGGIYGYYKYKKNRKKIESYIITITK